MTLQVGRIVFDPHPHRCPVCQGVGTLPHNFYTQLTSAFSTERVTCRSCEGHGVIWAPNPAPMPGTPKKAREV